jgi:hypothetical protein
LTSGSQQSESQYTWWQIFLPDRGGWFFAYLMFGMLFVRPELLLWDGGSCRHILNGVIIFNTHHIPVDNFTSWANANVEVITRAWLSDLISGAFYIFAGLNGVVFICALLTSATLTWSYQMGRSRGLGLASGLLLLATVMATVGMHWSARSHIYSYAPFLILYYLLFMTKMTGWKRTLGVALTECLWVNLHGSFTIGMAMILIKMLSEAVQYWRNIGDKSRTASQLRWDAAALAAAVAATAINPRGLDFYLHVVGYLSNPTVRRTDEWKSFDLFSGMGAPAFLVLAIIVATMIWKTKRFSSRPELALLILLAIAGLNSMRLIPYCALIAMPVVGPAWQAIKTKVEEETVEPGAKLPWYRRWLGKIVVMEQRAGSQETSSLRMSLLVIVGVLVMGLVAMKVPWFAIKDFDSERIPVAHVAYLTDKSFIDKHGFNYDNWGGYLYMKSKQRVFIDDWTDFLPVPFIDEYVQMLLTQPGWEKTFARYDFQWVLVPPQANIAQVLRHSPDWQVAKEDEAAVLLVRKH